MEFVSTNGGRRNLRTDHTKDVGGDIGIVLRIAGKLREGKSKAVVAVEIGELFLRVGLALVDQTEAVDVCTDITAPVGEETDAGVGVGFGIGVVDIEVGVDHAGVDGHIVGISLTSVVEDVVQHMYIGGVLAGEYLGVGLVGSGVEGGSVEVDIDVFGKRVDGDA